MFNEDKSGLVLSILRPDFERRLDSERVKIFLITPSSVRTLSSSFATDQSALEYTVQNLAAQLGLLADTEFIGDIDEVYAPPEGFGYLIEIANVDGTDIVQATFHEVIIRGELTDADRELAKSYLNRLVQEWHLSDNLVLA